MWIGDLQAKKPGKFHLNGPFGTLTTLRSDFRKMYLSRIELVYQYHHYEDRNWLDNYSQLNFARGLRLSRSLNLGI